MLQFVSQALPGQVSEEAAEIERFRARHRQLLRSSQQQQLLSAKVQGLDEDDGRRRKVPANWRQKQQQTQQSCHQSDGHWNQSEDVTSFNAFDFSASPELFHAEFETPAAPCAALQNDKQRMADVAKQVTSMGFNCGNMWQPVAGPSSWAPPTHYSACSDRGQALYHQTQYYE